MVIEPLDDDHCTQPWGSQERRQKGGAKKGANEADRQLLTECPGHIVAVQEFDKRLLTPEDEEKIHIISPKDEIHGESGLAIMARRFNDNKDKQCIS